MDDVKKEDKYIVIKKEDLDEGHFHSPADVSAFWRVLDRLQNHNKYIVCNQDEPYAEKVWQVILEGERAKQGQKPTNKPCSTCRWHSPEDVRCMNCHEDNNLWEPKPSEQADHKEPGPTRHHIITLVGSTRYKDIFEYAMKELTLAGNIVLTCGCWGHVDNDPRISKAKEMLDELHKVKIDLSNEIMIISPDGYIGDSTKREIEYAKAQGKYINRWLIPIPLKEPEPDPATHRECDGCGDMLPLDKTRMLEGMNASDEYVGGYYCYECAPEKPDPIREVWDRHKHMEEWIRGNMKLICPCPSDTMLIDFFLATKKYAHQHGWDAEAEAGKAVKKKEEESKPHQIHFCMDILGVLKQSDKEIVKSGFSNDGKKVTAQEIREFLRTELQKGYKYLTYGECDNRDSEGRCAGHPISEADQTDKKKEG